MANLIERYIYDVTRRLPEEEREEVGMELSANINDMLPENAEEEQIKAVLYELSAPALLAEEYRQKLRYLISPAVYDAYIRMLKWVVPMVGVILLVVGAISGGIDAISGDGPVSGTEFSISILSNGITFGLDGAFQSLLWVTVIFIIMDRTGYRKKNK